jgi:hypothetical protein
MTVSSQKKRNPIMATVKVMVTTNSQQ